MIVTCILAAVIVLAAIGTLGAIAACVLSSCISQKADKE